MTNDKLTIKDIILEASGRDENKFNKSSVGLFYEMVNENGDIRTVEEITVDKPVINIFKSMKRVQVDIIFSTKNDIDLKMMNDLLLKATDARNSVTKESKEFPLISVSIVPHLYQGQYFILCSDPLVWCLTGQNPRGEFDTLRLVFDEDDFNVLASDEEALDKLLDDIEEELDAEERTADFYAEKEAELKAKSDRA